MRIPRDACMFHEFWRARELIEIGSQAAHEALSQARAQLGSDAPRQAPSRSPAEIAHDAESTADAERRSS